MWHHRLTAWASPCAFLRLFPVSTSANAAEKRLGARARVKWHQRRVELANELLTRKLDDSQRKLAITTKLNALVTLYGLGLVLKDGVPNVVKPLGEACNEYLNSQDVGIQKLAKLSLLKLNAFEMIDNELEMDAGRLVEEMSDLLDDFPDNALVKANIDTIIEYYRRSVDEDVATKIAEGLKKRSKD